MSKIIKGAALFFMLILAVAIMLTQYGRAVRNNENTNALVNAIDTSLAGVMEQKAYTIANSDEFVSDFLETLLIQYQSDSSITVKILKQDMVKGLLSVEVDEMYIHPNGNTGTVSVRRTVAFDKKKEEAATVYHTIQFWADGKLYKSYSLPEGATIIKPKSPIGTTEFDSWYDKNTSNAVAFAGLSADHDYNFEARFK